jgi:hypothetical protein
LRSVRTCLGVLAFVVIACGTPQSAVRIETQAYLERSKGWARIEGETARTIERIFDTQFVNEAEVLRQIADSRPRVLAHLAALRVYEPRSEDIVGIHARYVAGWEKLLTGYDAIEKGFATGDYMNLARGREDLTEWGNTILTVAQELRELMRHFGLDASGTVESRALDEDPHPSMHRT